MDYDRAARKLNVYRKEIGALRKKMRKVQGSVEPQRVEDYTFATPRGPRRLSELFGDKRDLFVIHNMGSSCRYCTLWADGFNGVYPHLADRAAFVVSSPDAPDRQKKFAAARGWRFPMVSHEGSSFPADMGYRAPAGGWLPGITTFRKNAGRVLRVADASCRPHDDFCTLWHLFDLLPEGSAGWKPKYSCP